MAGINQMITLGVGTPSDIPHLVLTGLSVVGIDPPPDPTTPSSGAIQLAETAVILANATEAPTIGESYAVPSKGTRISWQTIISLIPSDLLIQLQASLDGTNWDTIDESTNINGEFRTLRLNTVFIRAVLAESSVGDPVDVTVMIMVKREKLK